MSDGSAGVKAGDLRAVAASLGGGAPPAAPSAPVVAPPVVTPPVDALPARSRALAAQNKPYLGEELPIFCERCGYALHGLPQDRCERCTILHFTCPECGHHQPINTLRPAAQRILGRLRGFVLGLWVFVKLNFFGWLLFGWFGMGVEWSYRYNPQRNPAGGPNAWTYQFVPREVDIESSVAFAIFALAFGMVGRMMLLRWRRGWAVGAVLGGLVFFASSLGAWFRGYVDIQRNYAPHPLGLDFQLLLVATGLTVVFAAVVVWPIWLALTHLFLPARTAAALLDWQRSIPSAEPILARQE